MHRMGPSFKRQRFAIPVFFLGAIMFISITRPSELGVPEREIFNSFQSNCLWIISAIISGAFLLSGSSNYRTPNYPLLLTGSILGVASCYFALMELMESSIIEILRSSLTFIGLLIGASAFVYGSISAEKSTKIFNESSPLSEGEMELVSKVLGDRLEGA